MIVYVESNFVLELALLQSGHRACSEIVEMAERREIRLVLPAVSVIEPYDTWGRRSRDRRERLRLLTGEIQQLARSEPLGDLEDRARELLATLATSVDDEKRRLDDTLVRVLGVAEIISVTGDILTRAIGLQATLFDGPHDAIIYAAVSEHLAAAPDEPKLFINLNSKDFRKPEIEDELESFGCKLLPAFDQGLGYIRDQVGRTRGPGP